MALKLSLKPGERFVVNGAVLQNGDRRAVLLLQNKASILREKDIIQPEEANSPAKRIYFLIMMMYLAPAEANKYYDEFVLRGQTPAQPGPIWFKVQQLCEKGQWDWFETPVDPKSTSRAGLKAPAALLEVLPGMGSEEHRH